MITIDDFEFRTKKPLPFGTLGVHKKKEFTEANEAFFIFDCLYYNGESLLRKCKWKELDFVDRLF